MAERYVSPLKTRILDVIEARKAALFSELETLDGFQGQYEYALQIQGITFLVWDKISAEAIEALEELVAEKKISRIKVSKMTYQVAGERVLKRAEALKLRAYKNTRWYPIGYLAQAYVPAEEGKPDDGKH